ncbi:hypothetical protein [Hydrogenoanaerobacterium sp.]|uniref:hypothetical protein n=1 Tax=Hydrogenoanaerobacterium sp. TaxID=2953763 RepID=UPI00289688E1|nr:hypothetical protein [Hydrogenoanaerobacterium sp.]
MSSVNILWLYDDLLDLYGDSGNLTILCDRLNKMGIDTRISRLSLGDNLDFSLYHMVYIGPGKAKNVARASGHFQKYSELATQAVANGVIFLVTGNARLLFGKSFTGFDGGTYEGIGLFDYTARETGNVFISDVVASPVFAPDVRGYGFINRTAHIDGNSGDYLFTLQSGAGDNETETAHEGNLVNNFFGTWQLGPVLVKNPHLLNELLRRLTGENYQEPDNSLEQKALNLTLEEFQL